MQTPSPIADIGANIAIEVLKSGVSGALILFMWYVFREFKLIFIARLQWLSDQLTAYMADGREITKQAAQNGILRASKWTPIKPGDSTGGEA